MLLARLSAVQGEALRLRFFAGLTFPEIAQRMQCSLGTAKNRVRWGLLRLSQWIAADSIGPDAARENRATEDALELRNTQSAPAADPNKIDPSGTQP